MTPVKKPRRKAVAKKGATLKIQTITTAPPVVAAPVIPTPSTSPLNEEDETSQIPALFQNYSLRMLEELEKVKVDRERLLTRESDLLFEIRRLTNRVRIRKLGRNRISGSNSFPGSKLQVWRRGFKNCARGSGGC